MNSPGPLETRESILQALIGLSDNAKHFTPEDVATYAQDIAVAVARLLKPDMIALVSRIAGFSMPKGNFPKGEDDADDNAETLTAVIEEARALTGIEGLDQCRTCGNLLEDAGDGWDGECEECADRTENGYTHRRDEDCTPDENGICTVCRVGGGDPCHTCGGIRFHRDQCSQSDNARDIIG